MAALDRITRGYIFRANALPNCSSIVRTLNLRWYARIYHRNPIKVLTSEEVKKNFRPSLSLEEKNSNSTSKNNLNLNSTFSKNYPGKAVLGGLKDNDNQSNKFKKPVDASNKVYHGNSVTVTSNSSDDLSRGTTKKTNKGVQKNVTHPVIKDKTLAERKISSLLQCVKSVKARSISGKILLEGQRLIADALNAGVHAEAIFYSNPELINSLPFNNQTPAVELYQLSHEKIQLWSDLTTSPGIMGIFVINKDKSSHLKPAKHLPLTIVCDDIKDPGNMGAIIRCAAAVGCQTLITTPDCVDAWDSKVLRAAAGGHFRTHLDLNIDWDLIAGNYVTDDTTVVLADSVTKTGIPVESQDGTDDLRGKNNLLNVNHYSEASIRTVEVLEDGDVLKRNLSYVDETLLMKYKRFPIPHVSYDDLKIDSSNPILLVIGGEARGLSSAANKLAHDFSGFKVSIPLENGVESLNAGVAVGILAYEIRRLLLAKPSNKKAIDDPATTNNVYNN